MLKWFAVWTAIIGGVPVDVADEDGPGRFPTRAACARYLDEGHPRISDVLRAHVPPAVSVVLLGDCRLRNRGRPAIGRPPSAPPVGPSRTYPGHGARDGRAALAAGSASYGLLP